MAKNLKYVDSESYDHTLKSNFETVPGKSQTIAGESYTVQELFERHHAGQLVSPSRESYWEDTQDFDAIDFNALRYADPFEKEQLLIEVKQKAEKAQKALEEWRKNQLEMFDDDGNPIEDPDTSKTTKNSKSKSKQASPGEPASKRSDASEANSGDAGESVDT